jgi:transposase-like protein
MAWWPPRGVRGLTGRSGGPSPWRTKLAIVEEYDQLADGRDRGALLRREGLYHSHIQQWREARDKGLSGKPAGRPARSQAEVDNQRLRKENEKLAAELARTKAAIEVMGKAHALLELLSGSADSGTKPTR